LERRAHQVARHDRLAVVRDSDGPGAHHLPEFGEALAFLPYRDRADRIHPRESGPDRLAHDEADRRLVVRDRIGVRHGADRREAAGGGRARSGHPRWGAVASSGRPPASRYNTAIRTATPFVT